MRQREFGKNYSNLTHEIRRARVYLQRRILVGGPTSIGTVYALKQKNVRMSEVFDHDMRLTLMLTLFGARSNKWV